MLLDLHSNNVTEFEQDASQWLFDSLPLPINSEITLPYSVIDPPQMNFPSRVIVGGFDCPSTKGFRRVYTDLGTHASIGLTLSVFYFPKDQNELSFNPLKLRVVGLITSQIPFTINTEQLQNFDSPNPGFVLMKATFPHTEDTLTLELVNESPSDKVFGFRELTITFSNRSEGVSGCMVPYRYPNVAVTPSCGCPMSQARDQMLLICQDCAPNCHVCHLLDPSRCFICKQLTSWDGTQCAEDCHASCQTCSGPGEHECLTCKPEFFNYGNGTCAADCSGGYEARNELFETICELVCTSLYIWEANSSCVMDCEFPLQTSSRNGKLYCENPCSPGNYLYLNGSCKLSCPSPLITINDPGVSYCLHPCEPPNIFFLPNGLCSANCTSPAVVDSSQGFQQCKSPCEGLEYFYEQENECRTYCNFPDQLQQRDFIKLCQTHVNNNNNHNNHNPNNTIAEASINDIQGAKDISDANSVIGQIASIAIKVSSAMNSNSPTLTGHSSMLLYFRYMKINYPAKLLLYFLMQESPLISVGFKIDFPLSLEENIKSQRLPDVFEHYKLHSDFVVNSWDSLITLILVLMIIFVARGLLPFTNKSSRIYNLLEKILKQAKWNMPLMVISGSLGEIVFYSYLQFKTTQLDESYSVISLFLALGMVPLSLWIVYKTLIVIIAVRKNLKKSGNENMEKWKDYGLLFSEYKEDSFFKQAFLVPFLLRAAFFHLIIASLFNYPLLQAMLLSILNTSIFFYLTLLRPLKSLLELIQICINEALIMIVTISVLVFAILDNSENNAFESRSLMGDMIIIINTIFCSLPLVFFSFQGITLILNYYRASKVSKTENNQVKPQKVSVTRSEKIQKQKKILFPPNKPPNVRKYWPDEQNVKDTSLANLAKEPQFDSFIEMSTFNDEKNSALNHQLVGISPPKRSLTKIDNSFGEYSKGQTNSMNDNSQVYQAKINNIHRRRIRGISSNLQQNQRILQTNNTKPLSLEGYSQPQILHNNSRNHPFRGTINLNLKRGGFFGQHLK